MIARCLARASPRSAGAASCRRAPLAAMPVAARRWKAEKAAAPTEGSTDAAPEAAAGSESTAPANPKIDNIVKQIGDLTLVEVADLVSTLKTRLNIPDMAVGSFAAGPAAGGAAAPAAEAAEEEEATPKAEEKTLFNITLEKIDAAAKPKIIKEIKNMLGLSLVDSKKFVESAPKLMKESLPKDECEKIIETMKGLGAVVKMD